MSRLALILVVLAALVAGALGGSASAMIATGASAGATATDGVDGIDGADGAPGRDGLDGRDGADGAVGPAGRDGATGPAGLTGAPGPQGAPGATGPQGDPGDAGPQGATGPQGAAGPRGEFGPQGPQGEIGPAGQDAVVAILQVPLVPESNEQIVTEAGGGASFSLFDFDALSGVNTEPYFLPDGAELQILETGWYRVAVTSTCTQSSTVDLSVTLVESWTAQILVPDMCQGAETIRSYSTLVQLDAGDALALDRRIVYEPGELRYALSATVTLERVR